MLELDISGLHERNLEPMYVEVGATFARERPGGAVVVGMDVRDHELAEPSGAELLHGPADHLDRLLGVHPAIEKVRLVAVLEEEYVDQSVLERDRQPELENVGGDLGQRRGRHERLVGTIEKYRRPV